MIFSDPEVSKFVRENFLAAWESVRPVPIVEIDFGNGNKLKRTLNGNIATYLCMPDGRVLDILTGIIEPKAFLRELTYAMNLYRAAQLDFETVVLAYHKDNLKASTRYEMEVPDHSKSRIERPMKKAVGGDRRDLGKEAIEEPMRKMSEEERLLEEDTVLNLFERRPAVHAMLAEKTVRPADVTKRLYKDVLHCDLDDPYLGLATKAFNGGGY